MHASLPSFRISMVRTGNCTSVTNTGTYSCLRTMLRMKRVFSYYLLQLYVPSFMLVVVSTVSFWYAPPCVVQQRLKKFLQVGQGLCAGPCDPWHNRPSNRHNNGHKAFSRILTKYFELSVIGNQR